VRVTVHCSSLASRPVSRTAILLCTDRFSHTPLTKYAHSDQHWPLLAQIRKEEEEKKKTKQTKSWIYLKKPPIPNLARSKENRHARLGSLEADQ